VELETQNAVEGHLVTAVIHGEETAAIWTDAYRNIYAGGPFWSVKVLQTGNDPTWRGWERAEHCAKDAHQTLDLQSKGALSNADAGHRARPRQMEPNEIVWRALTNPSSPRFYLPGSTSWTPPHGIEYA